ncbi:MAG: hypothetical protein ACXU7H_09580 [Burkholderiaceae bacterium]
MSTRQKIATHISMAVMFAIGLCAYLARHNTITEYVTLPVNAVEMKLIEIKARQQTPSVNSTSETDTQSRK